MVIVYGRQLVSGGWVLNGLLYLHFTGLVSSCSSDDDEPQGSGKGHLRAASIDYCFFFLKKSYARSGYGTDQFISFHLRAIESRIAISIVQAPTLNDSTPRTNRLTFEKK